MLAVVDQIKQSTKLKWNRVFSFKSKVNLYIDTGAYRVKTVETQLELIESLRLRYEVFHKEFKNVSGPGIDVDKYDRIFDHLIIVHKESNKIVGTYRLNVVTHLSQSYAAQEFDLNEIKKNKNEIFLELGRACIHKDHRTGTIVLLLWRGIAEYMSLSGATVLIGVSSLKINSTRNAALVYKYLHEQGHVTEEIHSTPTTPYLMRDFDIWYQYFGRSLTYYQIEEAKQLLPALLKSYLKLGAKIVCEPAYDEDFFCIDLLTVLKKENFSKLLAKRFGIE